MQVAEYSAGTAGLQRGVGIATGLMTEESEFESRYVQEFSS